MKSLVSITVVLILLSNFYTVLSAQPFQENIPLKYLTKFSSHQPTLQHQVAKRQTNNENTPTPEDMAICEARLNDAACRTGLIQGIIEASLSCGYSSIEEAQKNANTCAKGEGGQFCGSLLDLYRIRTNYIQGNCSRLLTLNSCSLTCRSLLEDFRSTFGCCINTYLNGTILLNFYYQPSSIDYHVWNLCNVPLPPADCGNTPTINPPDNIQDCTDEDVFNKYYVENICLPEHRQPYVDVLKKLGTSICGDITPSSIEDVCSVDTNGVPCGILYIRSSEDLDSLDSACSTSDINCTSNCRDGITAARNHNGCCLRSSVLFNSSGIFGLSPSYLSSSVLESCDIKLPGTCEGIIGSAVSIVKENYTLLIIFGIMCLQLLMIA